MLRNSRYLWTALSMKMFGPSKFSDKFIDKLSLSNVLTFSIASYTSWNYYLFLRESLECDIYCEWNEQNKDIMSKLNSLKKGFKASFLLPSAFLQMTFASQIEKHVYDYDTKFERQLQKLPDGGVVALDWLNKKPNQKIVIITHGLTGGSECLYIRHAASQLAQQGFTVVCFNQRGVSNSPILSSRYHCHGDTDDLAYTIDQLKTQFDTIYGLGISIGGNLLMKYAGITSDECPLKGIVTLGNPFDLKKCSQNILQWHNKIYDFTITTNFQNLLKKNADSLKANQLHLIFDFENAMNSRNTYEFDEYFTRRINKFKDVDELYDFISCKGHVPEIKIPVLCIQSKDDPIVPQTKYLHEDLIKKNPNIIIALTNGGGHIEWYQGLKPQRWALKPTTEFFQALSEREVSAQAE